MSFLLGHDMVSEACTNLKEKSKPTSQVEAPLHMSFQQRHVGKRGIYGQRDVKRNLWEAAQWAYL
jgi:hypothetical protein